MALFGSLTTVRAQLVRHPHFDRSLAYLDDALRPGSAAHLRAMAVALGETNRVELGEGVFALEQAYSSKLRAEGRLESHRQYIDVQVLLAGEEFIEIAEISGLKVSEDLTPAKDVIFYHDRQATTPLRLVGLGATAVFFPPDGHMGGLAITAPALVRKIVIKVPVIG
jgi:YhcH/YjgK/YiaL family protein